MPALGVTIDEDTVAAEYRESLLVPDGLAGFRRQALNQRTAQRSDPAIPLNLWDGCAALGVERPADGLVFAVDVSPEQASASIGVCWRRPDGVPHLELIENAPGVGWVPDRVSELRERWGGVWLLDPRGASGSQQADWPGQLVKAAERLTALVLRQALEEADRHLFCLLVHVAGDASPSATFVY